MNAIDISASALSAQRIRMNAIAGNIANAHTTRDAEGRPRPYKRLEVLFAPGGSRRAGTPGPLAARGAEPAGVRVVAVREARDPYQWTHDPGHPDAVQDPASERYGYVLMPRINVVEEMVDMMLASRAYEANLTAHEATKAMRAAALRIIA